MNTSIIFVLALFCVFVNARPDQYTTKYDNVNVDQIIKNDRLLKNYVNCLMERGRCSKDGEELKKLLPDAIQTGCTKCTDAQKSGSKKIVHHLIDNKPEWWNELEAKYDPQGSYKKQYQQEIKKEGFTF